MKVKVYGKEGCKKCTKLKEKFEKVVQNENLDADVEKVNDLEEMVSLGVMSTPAVTKDGEVVFSGEVPSEEEILKVLK